MTTIPINTRRANAWKALEQLLTSTSGKIGFILTSGIILMALLAPIVRPLTQQQPETTSHD